MKKKDHFITIFIVIALGISSVLPSMIRRTAKADNIVSSVVFSEDFLDEVSPEIGDQFKKIGGKNFWGTVRSDEKNILWTDYLNIPYKSNVSNSVVAKKIDLSSPYITSANLNFNISCDTELRTGDWNDYVTFSALKDDTWTELSRYDETSLGDENFHEENLNLVEYLGKNFEFKITWNTNGANNEHLGCAIWPIEINIEESISPLSGTLAIKNHLKITKNNIVTLNPLSSRAKLMRFSNNNFDWTDWIPYASEYSWDLTDTTFGGGIEDGDKKVNAQFKDSYGEIFASDAAAATIELDRSVPTANLKLDASSNDTSNIVSLSVEYEDNSEVTMKLSNDAVAWTDWLQFEPIFQWDITNKNFGGNENFGDKPVFLLIKDEADNLSLVTNILVKYNDNKLAGIVKSDPEKPSLENNSGTSAEPQEPSQEEKLEPPQKEELILPVQSPEESPVESSTAIVSPKDQNSNRSGDSRVAPIAMPGIKEVIDSKSEDPISQEQFPESTKVPFSVVVTAFPLSVYMKSYRKFLKKKKNKSPDSKLDQEILLIQNSTVTAFNFSRKAHNFCRSWGWYYTWHLNPEYIKSHFLILVLIVLLAIVKIFTL